MSGKIENKLKELGIELPDAPNPVANYQPYVMSGNLIFLSGQVTIWNGEMKYKGKIGRDLTVDQGYKAARMCGLNLIAQVRSACNGDLDTTARKWVKYAAKKGVDGLKLGAYEPNIMEALIDEAKKNNLGTTAHLAQTGVAPCHP